MACSTSGKTRLTSDVPRHTSALLQTLCAPSPKSVPIPRAPVLSLRQSRVPLHLFRDVYSVQHLFRGAYSVQHLFFVCTPIPSVTHIPVSVSMSVLAFS